MAGITVDPADLMRADRADLLAIGGLLFSRAEKENERKIAEQRREQDQKIADSRRKQEQDIADEALRQPALQQYLDRFPLSICPTASMPPRPQVDG